MISKSSLLLAGFICLAGFSGCSTDSPRTPPASTAIEDSEVSNGSATSAQSEGSATSADEVAPPEGSGD